MSRKLPGARKLRAWRKANGLSQAETARRIGCDGSSIRHFEGGRSVLSIELSVALARETGISLAEILPPERVRLIREAAALLESQEG